MDQATIPNHVAKKHVTQRKKERPMYLNDTSHTEPEIKYSQHKFVALPCQSVRMKNLHQILGSDKTKGEWLAVPYDRVNLPPYRSDVKNVVFKVSVTNEIAALLGIVQPFDVKVTQLLLDPASAIEVKKVIHRCVKE